MPALARLASREALHIDGALLLANALALVMLVVNDDVQLALLVRAELLRFSRSEANARAEPEEANAISLCSIEQSSIKC